MKIIITTVKCYPRFVNDYDARRSTISSQVYADHDVQQILATVEYGNLKKNINVIVCKTRRMQLNLRISSNSIYIAHTNQGTESKVLVFIEIVTALRIRFELRII